MFPLWPPDAIQSSARTVSRCNFRAVAPLTGTIVAGWLSSSRWPPRRLTQIDEIARGSNAGFRTKVTHRPANGVAPFVQWYPWLYHRLRNTVTPSETHPKLPSSAPPSAALSRFRHSALAGPALLFIICCGFCWKLVLSNQYTWIDNYDTVNMDVPRLQFQQVTWQNREFPLWDPHLWCGQPFLGEIAGAAYPLNWPFFLLKPNARNQFSLKQLNWYFFGLHFLGALFAYWLCRELGISTIAALLGGAAFSFSGFFSQARWPEVMSGFLAAPLVLLFLVRALRRCRPYASAALAGMFLGLCWLSGHHEIPIYLSMAVAAIWLSDLVWHRVDWRQSVRLASVTVLFTILTSAFQTVPGYEYARLAKRWVGLNYPIEWNETIPYRIDATYSFAPSSLMALVVPWGGNNMEAFAGVMVLTLAVIAICARWQDRWVRLFTCLALAGLLLSLGGWNPFHGLLYTVLPLFAKTRNPNRLVSMFDLGVAFLAAFGLDCLRVNLHAPFARNVYRALALLAGFIFAVGLAAVALQKPAPTNWVFLLGLIAALFAAALFARQNGSLSSRALTGAVLALTFIELGNVSAALYVDRHADRRENPLPKLTEFHDLAEFLRAQPGPVRVQAMEITGLFNLGDWEGIDTLYGFGAGATKNILSLDWASVRTQNLLAIGYSLSKQPPRSDQKSVFQGSSGVSVLRNVDALPRARIIHGIEQASTADEVARRVDDASFDARNTGLMIGPAPALESCTGDEWANISKRTANSVVIDARLACRGMLILADTWYPGWSATVDGRTVPIHQAYAALRGVVMDQGPHRLEFHFRPVSALIGAVLSAIGVLGACAVVLWDRKRSGP